MNAKKLKVEQLITSCSMVFKSYLYDVVISKNKANLWHFTAAKKEKKFVVYCTADITKVRGIIKVALKKIPADSKLVVICSEYENEDFKQSIEGNYSLVTLSMIRQYGADMISAQTKNS